MKIICVDDEPLVLDQTLYFCRELYPNAGTEGFESASAALEYLQKNSVDIAILDINMPGMDGLMLAAEIKNLHPDTAIVFLTGYTEYAVEAYAMHASGYVLKPVSRERLANEIEYALSAHPARAASKIEVYTFGEFNVIVNGRRVDFRRSKSRELLACLIDRRGLWMKRKEIFYRLWEDGIYDRSHQKQLDVIIRSLRDTLREYGISEMIEMDRGQFRAVPESFSCDMYRFAKGDIEAIQSYRGEYLKDYSWASFTESYMDRVAGKQII